MKKHPKKLRRAATWRVYYNIPPQTYVLNNLISSLDTRVRNSCRINNPFRDTSRAVINTVFVTSNDLPLP